MVIVLTQYPISLVSLKTWNIPLIILLIARKFMTNSHLQNVYISWSGTNGQKKHKTAVENFEINIVINIKLREY